MPDWQKPHIHIVMLNGSPFAASKHPELALNKLHELQRQGGDTSIVELPFIEHEHLSIDAANGVKRL